VKKCTIPKPLSIIPFISSLFSADLRRTLYKKLSAAFAIAKGIKFEAGQYRCIKTVKKNVDNKL
jgi:hypothetical protein